MDATHIRLRFLNAQTQPRDHATMVSTLIVTVPGRGTVLVCRYILTTKPHPHITLHQWELPSRGQIGSKAEEETRTLDGR